MSGVFTYNGIEMEIKKTNTISRDIINSSDGTTYLYTRWTFDIICVVNPGSPEINHDVGAPLSYLSGPVRIDGVAPVETDHAVRQRLRTHRKPLEYRIGDSILLKSPPDGTVSVDSNNGPIVQHVNVRSTFGVKTMYVHFVVTTWVNDCRIKKTGGKTGKAGDSKTAFRVAVGGPGTPSGNPLLSHRWTKSESVDQDHFVTLTTEGTAVFDTTVLEKIGLGARLPDGVLRAWPDQYRQDLLPFIPSPGWKRDSISVTPDSDGTTLHYRVVDREQPYSFGSNVNLTRAECYTTGWFGRMGIGQATAMSTRDLLDLRAGSAAVGIVMNQMPKYRWNVLARVWGNALSRKASCIQAAVGLVLNRMVGLTEIGGNLEFDSVEFFVSVDDTGKWAEASLTVNTGLEQLVSQIEGIFTGGGAGHGAGIRNVAERMAGRSETIGFAYRPEETPRYTHDATTSGLVNFDMLAPGAANSRSPNDFNPPHSNKTRGTGLVDLFHQILSSDACTPPPCVVPIASPQEPVIRERVLCSPARIGSGSPIGSRRLPDHDRTDLRVREFPPPVSDVPLPGGGTLRVIYPTGTSEQ